MRQSCVIPLFIASLATSSVASEIAETRSVEQKIAFWGVNDPKEVREFLLQLQEGVKQRNRNAVADMVQYPIEVITKRGPLVLKSKQDLIPKFDEIFNRDVSKVVSCQTFDNLYVSWQGFGIGRGAVYFDLMFQGNKDYDLERDSHNFSDRRVWKMKIKRNYALDIAS